MMDWFLTWPIHLLIGAAIILLIVRIGWRKDEINNQKWREPVPPDDWMNDGR